MYALCSGSERKERSVHGFLNCLMQGTKTVMTRVELGGPLFLVAVIGGAPDFPRRREHIVVVGDMRTGTPLFAGSFAHGAIRPDPGLFTQPRRILILGRLYPTLCMAPSQSGTVR